MAFIDKRHTEAKFKGIIISRNKRYGKNLSGADIPYGHHFIANLRPDGGVFRRLHITRGQGSQHITGEKEQQDKDNAHNHIS